MTTLLPPALAPPLPIAAPPPPSVLVLSTSSRAGLSQAACLHVAGRLGWLGLAVRWVDARLLPLVKAGTDDEAEGPPQVRRLLADAGAASAIVIGAPVHRAAIAGISRNWVELLRGVLDGKPVLPLVGAGSVRAHLAGAAFQADLVVNFGAVAGSPVVVSEDLSHTEVEARLDRACDRLLGRLAVGGSR